MYTQGCKKKVAIGDLFCGRRKAGEQGSRLATMTRQPDRRRSVRLHRKRLLLLLKAILAVAFFFCHFVVASMVVMGHRS
ncbi:MAG: hypothetical protein ACT6T0_16695, partial [Nevskia sp.]|uniref:hypothetical protein n=1 Tax=Nevskia sp. TaxID=1929292 RepID=UPI0040359269